MIIPFASFSSHYPVWFYTTVYQTNILTYKQNDLYVDVQYSIVCNSKIMEIIWMSTGERYWCIHVDIMKN